MSDNSKLDKDLLDKILKPAITDDNGKFDLTEEAIKNLVGKSHFDLICIGSLTVIRN